MPAIRAAVEAARGEGNTIGLVPTMGALHAGHLSLVEQSIAHCDTTVVTIFVNPTQFNETTDLESYPRDLAADISALSPLPVDLVFAPSPDDIYPADHRMSVDMGTLGKILEGRFRPGHFSGVATILLKLFNLIPANLVFMGEKDYQQLTITEQLIRDSHLPLCVHRCPTIREQDGLAMSSRNRHLDEKSRHRARCIYESLQQAQDLAAHGECDCERIIQPMREHIQQAGGRIDYIALVDPVTLQPATHLKSDLVALVAVSMGSIRLIDNMIIKANCNAGR